MVARLAPTTVSPRHSSNGAGPGAAGARPRSYSANRNIPLVAVGVLLVVGCAIGFSSAWLRAVGRQEVLVTSNALAAGQVVTPSDLHVAQLSVGSGLFPVPAAQESAVVGRAMALPVAAGTLLTESDLGPGADPPSGQAVVGLALKPGQYPADVTAGDRVLVVTNPSSTADTAAAGATGSGTTVVVPPVPAIVVGVQSASATTSDSAVVEVQLAEGDGAAVATAASAGDIALVLVSSGSTS
jgi:hypothetical protein